MSNTDAACRQYDTTMLSIPTGLVQDGLERHTLDDSVLVIVISSRSMAVDDDELPTVVKSPAVNHSVPDEW